MPAGSELGWDREPLENGLAWGLWRLGSDVPVTLRLEQGVKQRLGEALTALQAGAPPVSDPPPQLLPPALPPGLQHIHPSWMRHVLARESLPVASRLAQLLRASGIAGLEGPWDACPPAELPVTLQTQLVHWLFQPLADPEPATGQVLDRLGPGEDWQLGAPRAVFWQRLTGPVLWRAVCERGAAEVGRSLFRADPVMQARAMATVGSPWAQVIARFAAGPVEAPDRDRARLAMARAAVMASNTSAAVEASGRPEAELRLAYVGLCAANNEITAAGPAAVRTMALRLPVQVGGCLWRPPL